MLITCATLDTKDLIVSRCSCEAVMSRKISSSAPSLLYFSANCTGSPASFIEEKCNPFTTLPLATSRHGITLLVSVKIFFLPPLWIPNFHKVLFLVLHHMHCFENLVSI